jgi:hypothetical protein
LAPQAKNVDRAALHEAAQVHEAAPGDLLDWVVFVVLQLRGGTKRACNFVSLYQPQQMRIAPVFEFFFF